MSSELLDARTGIIVSAMPWPLPACAPPGLHAWRTVLADPGPCSGHSVGLVGSGCAWDEPAARAAATGEAVERYASALPPKPPLRLATRAELVATGQDVLTRPELALHSDAQYAEPGFPFRWAAEQPILWSLGHRATDDRPVWVPSSVAAEVGASTSAVLPHFPVGAGVAAGRDRARTMRSALLEVVERDALATAWYLGTAPIHLVKHVASHGSGAEHPRLVTLPSVSGIPVVVARVGAPPPAGEAPALMGLGAAASADVGSAADKALAEAYQSLGTALALDDPVDLERAALVRPNGPLLPWRRDRRYLEDYRPDLRDAMDLLCHAQLALDPRVIADTDRWLAAAVEPDPSGHPPSRAGRPDPEGLFEAVSAAFGPPVFLDLTPPDVRGQDWWVIRCVVPGARSLAPAAFPFLADLDLPTTFGGRDALVPFA